MGALSEADDTVRMSRQGSTSEGCQRLLDKFCYKGVHFRFWYKRNTASYVGRGFPAKFVIKFVLGTWYSIRSVRFLKNTIFSRIAIYNTRENHRVIIHAHLVGRGVDGEWICSVSLERQRETIRRK